MLSVHVQALDDTPVWRQLLRHFSVHGTPEETQAAPQAAVEVAVRDLACTYALVVQNSVGQ
jgi:hypothetical protein